MYKSQVFTLSCVFGIFCIRANKMEITTAILFHSSKAMIYNINQCFTFKPIELVEVDYYRELLIDVRSTITYYLFTRDCALASY